MKFQHLLEKVKEHVVSYFEVHHDPQLIYHTIKHTKYVVDHATLMANHYQLSDEDFFVVIGASWFHDIGYITSKTDHETKSAAMAAEFLKEHDVTDTVIEKITACILATKMPQKPVGLLQQIICDADLFHLGTDDFAEKSKLMRKEAVVTKGIEMDKHQWCEKNIQFLTDHHYFTDYAQLLLNDKQSKNLQKLKDKEETGAEESMPENQSKKQAETITDTPKPGKKAKQDKPEKGIETMFRITSGNNQKLSDMADGKAHILITVNSIILSAIISLVLKKLDENNFLAIPTFLLLTVSLLSMIFSILATRPTVPRGIFTQDDIDKKKVNLLFFGNFYKMHLEDYTAGMIKVMNDKDFLYDTLIKDVFSQGVVLGRKYRLLRIAYSVFMYGLVLAVLAFIIASIIHNNTTTVIRIPHA